MIVTSNSDVKSKNVRRSWLVMLWVYSISSIVIFFITALYIREAPSYASKAVLSKLNVLNESSFFIELFIAFPVFYFCNYKKPGTKLLFCSVIWSYISIVALTVLTFSALAIYYKVRNLGLVERAWNVQAICFVIAVLVFMTLWRTGWLYLCTQLRKQNLKLGYQQVYQNETYKARLDRIEEINNIEKLNAFYSSCVREFPKIEKFLTAAFKRALLL